MFGKFAIFTKFTVSVKITTFKGNPFAIAFEFLLRILANVRHVRHLRQIRHFRQDRHSQRATVPSHFNFSLDFGEFSPFSAKSALSKGTPLPSYNGGSIQGRPPLFLDQTEARRAEKIVFGVLRPLF